MCGRRTELGGNLLHCVVLDDLLRADDVVSERAVGGDVDVVFLAEGEQLGLRVERVALDLVRSLERGVERMDVGGKKEYVRAKHQSPPRCP